MSFKCKTCKSWHMMLQVWQRCAKQRSGSDASISLYPFIFLSALHKMKLTSFPCNGHVFLQVKCER